MFLQRHRFIIFAICVSGAVIAATYFTVQRDKSATAADEVTETGDNAEALAMMRSIQPNDHVLGNPNAPIVFYVYSDFGCSYCKSYHKTMRLLTQTYGGEGNMAWVFRHMPYVQLHPEAPMYALASECVAADLGNNGFWQYADLLFEKADPLKPFSATDLVNFAAGIGADRQSFVTCMRSNTLMAEVEKDYEEGMTIGAEGTPFTVVDTPDMRSSYQGAQSYRVLAQALQNAVRTLEARGGTVTPGTDSWLEQDYMEDFDAMLGASSTSATTSVSTTTTKTTGSTTTGSILDGIIGN